MLDTTKIGDSIHAHRKRASLTQRKLGDLARIGISNISLYENGKIPCLYNVIAIAEGLIPTPLSTDWKNRGSQERQKSRQLTLQTYVGGTLNPD